MDLPAMCKDITDKNKLFKQKSKLPNEKNNIPNTKNKLRFFLLGLSRFTTVIIIFPVLQYVCYTSS